MNAAERLKAAHCRDQRDAHLRRSLVMMAACDAESETRTLEKMAELLRDGRLSELGHDGGPAARMVGAFALSKMADLAVEPIDAEEREAVSRVLGGNT